PSRTGPLWPANSPSNVTTFCANQGASPYVVQVSSGLNNALSSGCGIATVTRTVPIVLKPTSFVALKVMVAVPLRPDAGVARKITESGSVSWPPITVMFGTKLGSEQLALSAIASPDGPLSKTRNDNS